LVVSGRQCHHRHCLCGGGDGGCTVVSESPTSFCSSLFANGYLKNIKKTKKKNTCQSRLTFVVAVVTVDVIVDVDVVDIDVVVVD
jgi:hypothetical protein